MITCSVKCLTYYKVMFRIFHPMDKMWIAVFSITHVRRHIFPSSVFAFTHISQRFKKYSLQHYTEMLPPYCHCHHKLLLRHHHHHHHHHHQEQQQREELQSELPNLILFTCGWILHYFFGCQLSFRISLYLCEFQCAVFSNSHYSRCRIRSLT